MNLIELNEYNINPKLEIYRGLKYENVLKSFIILCNKKLGKEIFNKKKTFIRTLTNILASWMFTLYSNYNFEGDPFFPNDYSDTFNLEDTLINFCKFEKLKECYQNNLIELNEFKSSNNHLVSSKDYTINVIEKEFEREGKMTKFYKLLISHDIELNFNRLSNIIDNILIPRDIYEKLKQKFTGNNKYFDVYIWIMIYRYQLLGSNNNQLGVLPQNLLKMKNEYGLDFELFGSSVNFTLNNYCSLYYDIEKFFGSSGSFFNYKPEKGVYSFNPPYQSDVIVVVYPLLMYLIYQMALYQYQSILNRQIIYLYFLL